MIEPKQDVRRHLQTALLMLLDAALACLSLVLALQIYYDMNPPETLEQIWRAMPLLAVCSVGSFYALGLYRSLMRYASVDTMIQIATGTLIGSGLTYLLSLLAFTAYRAENLLLMPRPIYLVQWLLMVLMVGASRFSFRIMGHAGHSGLFFHKKHARRLMVVGAGWAGAQVIRDIQAGRYGDVEAIIAVDDDPSKRNTRIVRVPVVMGTDKVAEYAKQYAIDDIIIAIATPQQELSPLIQACVATSCRVRMYAAPQDMSSSGGRVRDVNIADLLGRAENHLDLARIEQVAVNLIDNAIKFTPDGGCITLRVRVQGALCIVTVADNGVGILPEDRPRVFERFFTADRAHTSGKGTGLGLSICLRIMEMHGQRIRLLDTQQGAAFAFTLELAKK